MHRISSTSLDSHFALFRRVPDRSTPDYSVSHLAKGADYHDSFSTIHGRAMIWRLEQRCLREFVYATRAASVIDVACGTGRVANFVQNLLPAGDVIGVDISECMLAEARSRYPGCDFRNMDARQAVQEFGPGSMDLATAFRFFANADDKLRVDVATQIQQIVRPGGFLIMNNHRNFWSPSYVLRRARPGSRASGALNSEILDLFTQRGFEPVARRSFGVWPQSERKSLLLPWWVVERIEEVNAQWFAGRHSAGIHTIWLLKRVA